MKKYEIESPVSAILSLLATIAFVVWAFVAKSDWYGTFYAIASLVFSPLIWFVLYLVFDGIFQDDDE